MNNDNSSSSLPPSKSSFISWKSVDWISLGAPCGFHGFPEFLGKLRHQTCELHLSVPW